MNKRSMATTREIAICETVYGFVGWMIAEDAKIHQAAPTWAGKDVSRFLAPKTDQENAMEWWAKNEDTTTLRNASSQRSLVEEGKMEMEVDEKEDNEDEDEDEDMFEV